MTTRAAHRPHCAFAFEVTFQHHHPKTISLATQKPPAHFHPHQNEYVEVLQGRMDIDIDGCERILGPRDGQIKVKPWDNPPAVSTAVAAANTAPLSFIRGSERGKVNGRADHQISALRI